MNYSGSSGGMEADAVEQLWSLSEGRHGFHYMTLLFNGDAKTHRHLCNLNAYDDGIDSKRRVHQPYRKRIGNSPSQAGDIE